MQQIIPDHILSMIMAVPLPFAVTFAAGMALERLVVRKLYHPPLESVLATFGVSIALEKLALNVFGTQARPLMAPAWLDGAWVIADVVFISYIRIGLAPLFLALSLSIRKRPVLETRAVTQNPRMAASMEIHPDLADMLTFELGSGIAKPSRRDGAKGSCIALILLGVGAEARLGVPACGVGCIRKVRSRHSRNT